MRETIIHELEHEKIEKLTIMQPGRDYHLPWKG
jgi:hypothetical protein